MAHAVQYLRSIIFNAQMYVAMGVIGMLFAPYALVSRKGALMACKSYCRWVIWTARWMVGIRTEVRGVVPDYEALVAAKHQSFFDILVIFNALPHAKFIMKREILWMPIIGIYAKRLGCVPVDRGKRGKAIAKMVKDVAHEFQEPGQLVIYPQGTRVSPGDYKPYKIGPAVLYEGLNESCVPVATNIGVYWPRKEVIRRPGLAVVEFLEPIRPGVSRDEFMQQLEGSVEGVSNALMREAGYDPDGKLR